MGTVGLLGWVGLEGFEGWVGFVGLVGGFAGAARRVVTRVRIDGMVKPRGSIFAADHSEWPMTERALQPWARQIAADARSIASSWAVGHGSRPLPRLTHSKP